MESATSMRRYDIRRTFLVMAVLFAAQAAAQEARPRAGNADKRDSTGSEAFGGSGAAKDQVEKESARGAASRAYSAGGADPWKMPSSPRGSSIVGGPRGGGGARF